MTYAVSNVVYFVCDHPDFFSVNEEMLGRSLAASSNSEPVTAIGLLECCPYGANSRY